MKVWVQLGIVGKAHGLSGAFFISQRDELLPAGLKELRIGPQAADARRFTLQSCRLQSGRPLLQCQELRTREAAEELLLQPIWCAREALQLDEEAEYLWADLIHKEVVDSKGKRLGRIQEIGNFGASDLVRIRDEEGRILELPLVSAYFDMNFHSSDSQLRLIVEADLFDETWSS